MNTLTEIYSLDEYILFDTLHEVGKNVVFVLVCESEREALESSYLECIIPRRIWCLHSADYGYIEVDEDAY